MERREAARALREDRPMRRLQEMDFLLGVADVARAGALRYRSIGGGAFLAHGDNPAPPVTSLRELAHISQRLEDAGVEELPEYEQWLAMLIAPGTSLGGARPKASFTDEQGRLCIAKFPAHEDRYDVGAWEFVTHQLAGDAGIWVPDARLEKLTDRYSTFCASRFDRVGADRRMFVSAMTLLERADGEQGASYLDLAECISDHGAATHIDEDLEQLFRRVVFNVLVGNRDDHPRNHGFIREPSGWRLSPAYDMNPNPSRAEHSLTLDGKVATPSIELVAETAAFYRLESANAKRIIGKVKTVVCKWQVLAESHGLPRSEIARMKTVFQV
jgi:serine/threonine-protein kinase HipA